MFPELRIICVAWNSLSDWIVFAKFKTAVEYYICTIPKKDP